MQDTSLLPLSPLTLHELNQRTDEHTSSCGYRVRNAMRVDGHFTPRDLAYLEEHATAANAYSDAAARRLVRTTT